MKVLRASVLQELATIFTSRVDMMAWHSLPHSNVSSLLCLPLQPEACFSVPPRSHSSAAHPRCPQGCLGFPLTGLSSLAPLVALYSNARITPSHVLCVCFHVTSLGKASFPPAPIFRAKPDHFEKHPSISFSLGALNMAGKRKKLFTLSR